MNKILVYEQQANNDLQKQAIQLQTVMKLKSLHTHGMADDNEKDENNVSNSNDPVDCSDTSGKDNNINTKVNKTENLVQLLDVL